MRRNALARHRILSTILRDPPLDDPDAGSASGGGGTGDGGGDPDAGKDRRPKITGDFDPDRAADAIGKARADADRAKAAQQAAEKLAAEQRDAIAVALGIKPDPKTDTAALAAAAAAERDQARADAAAARLQLAVFRNAGDAGGDAGALLDSVTFLDTVKGLDQDAADFPDLLAKAVKAAVKANPRLGTAAPAAGAGAPAGAPVVRIGADVTGGGGGTAKTVDQQIAEAQQKGDWATARDLKAAKLAGLTGN